MLLQSLYRTLRLDLPCVKISTKRGNTRLGQMIQRSGKHSGLPDYISHNLRWLEFPTVHKGQCTVFSQRHFEHPLRVDITHFVYFC